MSLLEELQISLVGIGHAISNHRLSVPVYQRSYAWTNEEVDELLQDLATAINDDEKEYFLGSIVLARNIKERSEVVDGQQRLATTTILLAAIRDYFYKSNDLSRTIKIEDTYLTTTDLRTQEAVARLQLNEISAGASSGVSAGRSA